MAKMHLKIKRRKSILTKILFIIIIGIFSSFLILNFLNKQITPNLLNYATSEVRKMSTMIINKSVIEKTKKDFDINKLIITTTNKEGKITSVDFNSYLVNRVLLSIANDVQVNLKMLEQGEIQMDDLSDSDLIRTNKEKLKKGIIYEIPLGLAFNNSLVGNLGPKIPVRLKLIGDIETKFDSKITDYGINNALLELTINITITEQVILPISSEKIIINTDIPVAIKLIEGEVPEYFSGSSNESSKFSIPIDK